MAWNFQRERHDKKGRRWLLFFFKILTWTKGTCAHKSFCTCGWHGRCKYFDVDSSFSLWVELYKCKFLEGKQTMWQSASSGRHICWQFQAWEDLVKALHAAAVVDFSGLSCIVIVTYSLDRYLSLIVFTSCDPCMQAVASPLQWCHNDTVAILLSFCCFLLVLCDTVYCVNIALTQESKRQARLHQILQLSIFHCIHGIRLAFLCTLLWGCKEDRVRSSEVCSRCFHVFQPHHGIENTLYCTPITITR